MPTVPLSVAQEVPVGFKFYYMTAMDPKLNPVVKKFLDPGIDARTVDQVGWIRRSRTGLK